MEQTEGQTKGLTMRRRVGMVEAETTAVEGEKHPTS